MSYGYKTHLKIDLQNFELTAMSYSFEREIDENGDVASPIEGGTIFLSMNAFPKDLILEWGMKHRVYKSGIIETIGINTDSTIPDEEIAFIDAACINLKIIYERDHSTYFTTLLTLSPRIIHFGRNETWGKKYNWTIEDLSGTNVSTDNISELFFPKDIAIDGFLHINEKQYEIQAFETEFVQPEDFKGQPQHEVKGGLIMITLKQKSDETLNKWMFQKDTSYEGEIVFAPVSRSSNADLRIKFTEGKLVSFHKMIGVNIGILFSIVISSQEIHINAVDHTNQPKY